MLLVLVLLKEVLVLQRVVSAGTGIQPTQG